MKNKRGYKNRITIDNRVKFGKPCIVDSRIPVENVLELIQEGITFREIIDRYYPDLEVEDVKACVEYATNLVKQEEVQLSIA